ncbi:uncharacterized protein LOC120353439 [Nilaparvata lugens]|uniref:uncharacterized protein LOC120353439 n=1 Tax=Nilaparvata lugens TaxID=108931 RepID=UPI00193E51BB|nr:uncharacterized protein LOC120353439 [Nilaparvata lugens]
MNDVVDSLQCNAPLYANDLEFYKSIQSPLDAYLLQEDIGRVNSWSKTNSMPINIVKTVFMTLTRKTNPLFHAYMIDGIQLKRENTVVDLGVTCDSKLLFNEHVDKTVRKARRQLGMINWITKEFKAQRSFCLLYCTLVRSVLEYASVIWQRERITSTQRIKAVQRKFVRMLCGRCFPMFQGLQFQYREACNSANLKSLQWRRRKIDTKFFHKSLHEAQGTLWRVLGLLCHLMRSGGTDPSSNAPKVISLQ